MWKIVLAFLLIDISECISRVRIENLKLSSDCPTWVTTKKVSKNFSSFDYTLGYNSAFNLLKIMWPTLTFVQLGIGLLNELERHGSVQEDKHPFQSAKEGHRMLMHSVLEVLLEMLLLLELVPREDLLLVAKVTRNYRYQGVWNLASHMVGMNALQPLKPPLVIFECLQQILLPEWVRGQFMLIQSNNLQSTEYL